MKFFSSLLNGSEWIVEKLNLKTDHHLKGDLSTMSDQKLLSNKGSTVRSVSSSVTGIAVNIALSVACPIFIAPAIISTIQLGVSATNCHRARREIKHRIEKDPSYKEKLRKRDTARDIVVGATVKGGFIALGAGIIGFDHIADNFAQLGHHVGSIIIAQHAGEAVSHNAADESFGQVVQHTHDRAADLQWKHPHLAKADSAVHKAVSGLGDQVAKGMEHITHLNIDDSTSWQALKNFLEAGASKATEFWQVAVVGVCSELGQLFSQAGEIGIDESMKYKAERKWEEKKEATKEALAEASQNLNRHVHGSHLKDKVRQQMAVNKDVLQSKLFRRRRQEVEVT